MQSWVHIGDWKSHNKKGSVLIIHGFHSLLITSSVRLFFLLHHTQVPSWSWTRQHSAFWSQLSPSKQVSCSHSTSTMFFKMLCMLLVISFPWPPSCSEVMLSPPERRKAWRALWRQIWRASQAVVVKSNLPADAGDTRGMSLSPGLGRSPGGGNGNPLQYSCLGNSTSRGAWQATVHGCKESDMTEQWSTHTHTHTHTHAQRQEL